MPKNPNGMNLNRTKKVYTKTRSSIRTIKTPQRLSYPASKSVSKPKSTKKVSKKVPKSRKFHPKTMVYNRGSKRWIQPNYSHKSSSSILRPPTFGSHSVAAASVPAAASVAPAAAMNSKKPTNIRMGNLAAALPNLNNNNNQKNNNDDEDL